MGLARDGLIDVRGQVVLKAPTGAACGQCQRGIDWQVPNQDADAAVRQPPLAVLVEPPQVQQVDAVVPLQVGFYRLTMLPQEVGEAEDFPAASSRASNSSWSRSMGTRPASFLLVSLNFAH